MRLQLKHRPCGVGRNLGLVFFLFQDYGLRRNDVYNLTERAPFLNSDLTSPPYLCLH